MSSRVDMPLDNLVKSGRARGRGKGRGRGRGGAQNSGTNFSQRGRGVGRGVNRGARGGGRGNVMSRLGYAKKQTQAQNGTGASEQQKGVSDLRDVLATKNKTLVVDLRAKISPKVSPMKPSKKGSRGREHPANTRSRSPLTISADVFHSPKFKSPGGGSSRSKDAIFNKGYREMERSSSRRLPTTAEAKKITVTVQGLSKTTSEAYRKEEKLAAIIARQKESRQQNFMRSREEFIASITSAVTGESRGDFGRGGMLYPRYRSPSPPILEYPPFDPLPPPPPPMGMGPPSRQRGITSVTTLIISNLNDTVSHSDVHELCTAIGPVENVVMTAPGVTEVTFRYKDDALEAYKKYNQRNLDGMPMMCRLQPGGNASRIRSMPPPPPQLSGYHSRLSDPFPPDNVYGGHGSYY